MADLDASIARLGVLALSRPIEASQGPADDEGTQVSRASFQAPSLSGKSTTSGLDEKESLRPDDSASMRAGDDDDASSALNSRFGSEAGSRAFRDQFAEDNHPLTARPPIPAKRIITDIQEEEPQDPSSTMSNLGHVRPSPIVPLRQPDEKIFEALESAKDRIFLLRLEQDIIDFIKNSSNHSITLPPCNSFGRLLAHKLADYYGLTHFVDNAVSAVTLYRAEKFYLPPPLHVLADARSQQDRAFAPVVQPSVKIMRRPGYSKETSRLGSGVTTSENSNAASKATSEAGDDASMLNGSGSPSESSKEKTALSRAEREARYREKREQLFGPQTGGAESNDDDRGDEKRRSKKKNNGSPPDDGFEARSQFNAYYPQMGYEVPPQPAYYNMYGMPMGLYPPYQYPQPFPPPPMAYQPEHYPYPPPLPPPPPGYDFDGRPRMMPMPFANAFDTAVGVPHQSMWNGPPPPTEAPMQQTPRPKRSSSATIPCQFGQMPYAQLPIPSAYSETSFTEPPFDGWSDGHREGSHDHRGANHQDRRLYGSSGSNATNTLAKWATPANLPPKPPPLDAPTPPDSLPRVQHFRELEHVMRHASSK